MALLSRKLTSSRTHTKTLKRENIMDHTRTRLTLSDKSVNEQTKAKLLVILEMAALENKNMRKLSKLSWFEESNINVVQSV